jgi:plastocyanin
MRRENLGGSVWRRVAGVTVFCVSGAVPGCVSPHEGERHVVEVRGFAYSPDTLRVAGGDTVVWVNRDVVSHTATSSEWDSGPLGRDDSWELVTSASDTIGYLCSLHPAMAGTLIIE